MTTNKETDKHSGTGSKTGKDEHQTSTHKETDDMSKKGGSESGHSQSHPDDKKNK